MEYHNEAAKNSLKNCFDRAIIAVSYSAANKITILISNTDQSIKASFVIFIISLCAALIILNTKLLHNVGIQTSLSIIMSKLVISSFPLPEEQTIFFLLPSIMFYLVLCSSICSFIDFVVSHTTDVKILWSKIVPFVVLFTSSTILQKFNNASQLKLLYSISICYIVLSQYYWKVDNGSHYALFFDSLICRSLVLCIQDAVKMSIDNMDIAIVIFNACIIITGYSLGTYLTQQMRYVVSVLTFTISQQLLTIVQKKCENQLIPTFLFVVLIVTIMMYNKHWDETISNISFNCFALACSSLIDSWITSFYNSLEPFIVYLIIFITLQSMQEIAMSLFDFSEGLFTIEKASHFYNYELMVIAHDTSSSVGLPPVQNF